MGASKTWEIESAMNRFPFHIALQPELGFSAQNGTIWPIASGSIKGGLLAFVLGRAAREIPGVRNINPAPRPN